MKTMESVYGHNKYRHTLTSNSYYQQPPIPHPRSGTLRPQSEYGFGGLGAPYSSRYSRGGGGGGGSSGGSGGSADWPPWGAPLGAPLAAPRHRARSCSALLAAAALLAALAVFAVAGLALYMGAFRSDTSEPILAFEGRFRLRRSVAAGSLAGAPPNAPRLESALRRACAPRLGPALVTLQMVDFNADKLTAFFRIYLDRRKVEGPIDDLGEIIGNILVENSITKNSQLRQLNVDPASISIKRDNDHTFKADMLSDRPTESKASLPILPQNTKEKVLQTRMGVIRKTAVTPTSMPTPSVKVKQHTTNNDEPEINVDELPVIQGSFQITKTEADITENKKKVESSNREPPRMSTKLSTVKESPTTKKPATEPIKYALTTAKSTVITNPSSTSTTPRTKTITLRTKTQTSAPTTEKIKFEFEIKPDEKLSDLPKLDTLFAVPSYVDQEPWKPIQPGDAFSTVDLKKPLSIPSQSNVEAEDRVGIAEVSEDMPTIEGVINANEFPSNFRIDQNYKEHFENNYSVDNNYKPVSNSHKYSENYPAPVYTSFKRPEFSTTFKESQTLGSNYPMPHPLPVNKLISNPDNEKFKPFEPVDSISEIFHNNQNKYVSGIPLKDRLSTVSINVEPFSNSENAEYINLNGGVIIRKQNSSNSMTIKTNNPKDGTETQFAKNELIHVEPSGRNHTNSFPVHPENPSLFTNQMTWELINETGNDHSKLKNNPIKSFNETLQAVVTMNEDDTHRPLKNDTNNTSNFQNVNNILRNITTIFTKLAASLRRPIEVEPAKNIEEKTSASVKRPAEDTVKPAGVSTEEIMSTIKSQNKELPTRVEEGPTAPPRRPTKVNREPVQKLQDKNHEMPSNSENKNDEPLSFHGQGSIEPVDMSIQELLLKESSTQQTSSTVIIPTLLPVKSNSGIGRPLRPRPKIPTNNDESRGFSNAKPFPFFSEMKSFITNLQPENVVSTNFNKTINDTELTFLDRANNTHANKSDISKIEISSTYPTTSIKTDVVTSISSTKNLPPPSENKEEKLNSSAVIVNNFQENKTERHNNVVRDHTRKIDISEKFRLPKTHPSEDLNINDKIEKSFENNNKTFVLPTATEFFLTHPSTQAIQLMEKVKTIIKDLENSNIKDVMSTAPSIIAPIESYKDFSPKNISFLSNYTQIASFQNDLKHNTSGKEFNKTVLLNDKMNTSVASNVKTPIANKTNVILTNEDILNIIRNISSVKVKNSTRILDKPASISSLNSSFVSHITSDKLKDLANIATITDSHNNSFYGNDEVLDDTVISTKAVSSSYTVNNAGFKILTKTFNKIPGNFKDDEKKNNKFYNEPTSPILNENTQLKETDDCARNNLTVMCSNGQCLPETARCNRLLDCPKGEDEAECTCADYLKSQFLLRKICDGILDCWDFSDENNCEWCNPDQYVCSNSRQCIDKDKVCDGHKDCPQGDDERQCVTVAMSQKDAQAYPYSKEGYIMVQKQGRWGRLCVQNFDKVIARSQSTLQIADLGRAVCRAMTYIDYENIDRVIEEGPETEKHYFSLHYGSRGNGGRGGLAFRKSGCSRGQVAKVVCSNLQCGARPQAASQQARIVGGGNAGAGAWPWQAALYKEGDFQCGATLISDRWLISAGHCFYHAQEDFWVARLGALRRGTTFPSPYEQLQPISSVILHPGYIDSGFINDIALLKTANKVAFSDYVRPICLPPPGSEVDDNRRCTVVGWGQLFEVGRIFPDTLQEVELPVISTGECRKRTLFLPLYRITEDMFCAGFDRGGRDACLGDSGGPLMCQEQDNQWYLYGVTSNGYGCARANRPGVYTKVANYVNWVQTTMQVYDDRSFDHPRNRQQLSSNRSASGDMEVSETRNFHRHVDKCRGHRCPLGECLPPTRVCNGFMECSDGSDEKDC